MSHGGGSIGQYHKVSHGEGGGLNSVKEVSRTERFTDLGKLNFPMVVQF